MTQRQVINASVSPKGSLETLSQREVQQLSEAGSGSTYTLFRQCALAILNTGAHVDNAKTILEAYKDFEIRIHQQDRGVRLELLNAPADAFVDGEMIASTREMLFSALRDIVYTENELDSQRIDLSNSQGISDYVFHLLRNARTLRPGVEPKIVVCWGGHSINTEEYKYTKKVGHELGLRSLDICTGCGPGVMKGPMKGATIAHAKQRIPGGRYLGLTEPGIIAAEAPNPIVNELVILPDIEKRLEAFVRVGHGIIIFPGGAGTAEEFLYLLGILMHPDNAGPAVPGHPDRAETCRAVSGAAARVRRRHPGRSGQAALRDHHRRPGRSGAADDSGPQGGEAVPPRAQRRVPLQLAAEDRRGLPAPVRPDPRKHGQPATAAATCHPMNWRPTCAGRSPGSWPATSRTRAFA